jgi:hypothetical protein
MYFDERHLATVAGEDGERRGTQVFAAQGLRVRCYGRDGRWSAAVRDAEAVHDVLRVDAGPHHDAHFGELRPDVRELAGQGALGIVLLRGLLEQDRALRMKRGEFARAMRETPIARRIANRGHELLPLANKKRTRRKQTCGCTGAEVCCPATTQRNLPTPCATYPANPC